MKSHLATTLPSVARATYAAGETEMSTSSPSVEAIARFRDGPIADRVRDFAAKLPKRQANAAPAVSIAAPRFSATAPRWNPRLRLTNTIPPRLDAVSLSTQKLLEEVAVTHAPLENWLAKTRFDRQAAEESIELVPECWPASQAGEEVELRLVVQEALKVVGARE